MPAAELRLDDGTVIGDLRAAPQGIRHRMVFGVERASGREVAAKIELIDGALELERRALEWLNAADGPAPRLLSAATVTDGEHAGALCLVTERIAGEAPTTLDGWERLGRKFARLAAIPVGAGELPTLDHDEFLALHEEQVARLDAALVRDLGATLPAVHPTYRDAPLILTHGDPGPGNSLDDGAEGTIVDWEGASVAPRGLDLGRLTFIALLGGGPQGYVATEQEARAEAARKGFLAAAEGWTPTAAELDWWFAVAGVQFAYWRLEREGLPAVPPWRDPVAILDATFAAPSLDA
jgi:aminoglycoside phosphotransferase (APT) family kinase protein